MYERNLNKNDRITAQHNVNNFDSLPVVKQNKILISNEGGQFQANHLSFIVVYHISPFPKPYPFGQ